jgi:hypothetical protein
LNLRDIWNGTGGAYGWAWIGRKTMATARTLSKLAKTKLPRSVDQELGVYILEKCRDLVEEYSELSRHAPDAFPFCEQDLVT